MDALLRACPNIHLVAPTDYLSFAYLLQHARIVLADGAELVDEMAALGKRVLLLQSSGNGNPSAAGISRVAVQEQAIAVGALALLNEHPATVAVSDPVEGLRDGCERIVEGLASFIARAASPVMRRPALHMAVAAAPEALREAS
jgi:UDP-N-acetylglucosamine 2-epimerase